MRETCKGILFMLCVCVVAPCIGAMSAIPREITITSSGETIFSPNYSRNHIRRYYIEAPKNHTIIINFLTFKLDKKKNEFLKVTDGMECVTIVALYCFRNSNASVIKFHGKKKAFKYFSTTRYVELRLEPHISGFRGGKGFLAKIYFVNRKSQCNTTNLNTNTESVISCRNEADDFASWCRVQCEEPTEEYIANCINGTFIKSQCKEKQILLTKSDKTFHNFMYRGKLTRSALRTYYIRAPLSHIIILDFRFFQLGEKEREFLRIVDGRKNKNGKNVKYFYGKKPPFKYVSKSRKLHILFKPDKRKYLEGNGFWAKLYFVNTTSHCNYIPLNTDVARVTSCENEVDDFATTCTVQCEILSKQYEAHCNNGWFSTDQCTEYCDVNSFQLKNATRISCDKMSSDNQSSRCHFRCDDDFVGGGSALCKNQTFVAYPCLPNATSVERCEDSQMLDCPFSLSEIVQFYETSDHISDEEISQEEAREIEGLPEPTLSRNQTSDGRIIEGQRFWDCPNYYCRNSNIGGQYRSSFKCKSFLIGKRRNVFRMKLCMYCRYESHCKRPIPHFFHR